MGQLSGSASADIDAPIDEVWAVIEDVESAPEWQKGMNSMQAIERDGEDRAELCVTESDAGVKAVKTHVRFSYDPPRKLSWRQEKGDLKSLEGSWTLEEIGDGRTRATYALHGDPGRVLGMLIRGPVEGKVRDVLVNGRPDELKRRVEGA